MSLISCPECGKKISDKAAACPHCGNPMNPQVQQTQQEEDLCCPGCGMKFRAGEAKNVRNAKKAEETEIIDIVKSTGALSAIKWYKEAHNCGLAEAKDAVDEICAKYHLEVVGNGSGTSCSTIVLIGVILALLALAALALI